MKKIVSPKNRASKRDYNLNDEIIKGIKKQKVHVQLVLSLEEK